MKRITAAAYCELACELLENSSPVATSTGGGCVAWEYSRGPEVCVLVTSDEALDLPQDGDPVLVGLYLGGDLVWTAEIPAWDGPCLFCTPIPVGVAS